MKKKLLALVVALVMLFAVMAESAFASSKLETTVDSLLDTPYVYGGTDTDGFDCSGFVMYVFAQYGIDLPHSSSAQSHEGDRVAKSDLRAGDLVFFNTGGYGISHVGIYLGDGEFVHASSNHGVVKNKLSESYYAKRYVTARRILDDDTYAALTADN